MLALFRTNQLLANVFLLPYVVLLHLHLFVNPEKTIITPFDNGMLSSWVLDWLPPNTIWSNVTCILLLFLQGVLLNVLVINNRLSREISLFPGLFYVLLASSIPIFLPLSPLLIANTFFILFLISLLSVYKKPEAASTLLNVGIWIGVASLFYFSYISLLFVGLVGLNILRALKLKERLMLLSGVVIPFFLLGVYFFWEDQLPYYFDQEFHFQLNWNGFLDNLNNLDFLKIGLFAILSIVALLSFGQYTSKQNIQVQKKINILFWTFPAFLLSLLFSPVPSLINLLFLTVPLGILLSFNMINIKRGSAETIHLIMLVMVLYLQYKSWFIVG